MAEEPYNMNKQRGRHMSGKEAESSGDVSQSSGQHRTPHIYIHPHHDKSGKHIHTSVHVMHSDGRHELSKHGADDHEGILSKVSEHYGGGHGGQDHGFSSGEGGEEEGALI
jgi:hypothetical protein